MALLGSGLILATDLPILHGLSNEIFLSSNDSMPLFERNKNTANGPALSCDELVGEFDWLLNEEFLELLVLLALLDVNVW